MGLGGRVLWRSQPEIFPLTKHLECWEVSWLDLWKQTVQKSFGDASSGDTPIRKKKKKKTGLVRGSYLNWYKNAAKTSACPLGSCGAGLAVQSYAKMKSGISLLQLVTGYRYPMGRAMTLGKAGACLWLQLPVRDGAVYLQGPIFSASVPALRKVSGTVPMVQMGKDSQSRVWKKWSE